MTVKVIRKKGIRVVVIKRGKMQIAPTYKELGECIRELIQLYDENEVLRETGLAEMLDEKARILANTLLGLYAECKARGRDQYGEPVCLANIDAPGQCRPELCQILPFK
jgi:hypothetical protein